MRKIYVLFFVAIISSCNYTILNESDLKGRVKKFTETTFVIDTSNNLVVYDTTTIAIYHYNRNGKVKRSQIWSHSKLISDSKIYYNHNNHPYKEISTTDALENDTVNKPIHTEFNYTYIYMDTLILEVNIDANIDSMHFNLVEKRYYDSQNQIKKVTEYQYLIDSKDTFQNNSSIYHYNHKHKLKNAIFKSSYQFDSTSTTSYYTYQFDSSDLLIETSEIDSAKTILNTSTYEYQFDSHGSWIERLDYNSDGRLKSTTIREIKYQ